MKPELDTLKAWLRQPLPAVFVAALEQYGGRLVEPGLLFCAVGELLKRNRAFETSFHCPDYLAIGNDSGDRAVVMALDNRWQVLFLVDHSAVTSDCFGPLAPSLKAWSEVEPCLPE